VRNKSEGDAAENKDDYKTVLTQAKALSRALALLGRGSPLENGSSSPPIPSPGLGGDDDPAKQKLELMSSLVQILSRNRRVRFEVDVRELLQGYARYESIYPSSSI
jgi:hypothetical protein